ncbi:MAG TPA: hypothetical protein VGP20_04805 [Steroidobacteraceae bacterium]|jgi:hypothetical protein|nr:hypothetical protein [Steroidobacteraceae bacterium]
MLNQPASTVSASAGTVARRRRVAAPTALALCACLSACGMHWPWRHPTPAAPQPVQALSVEGSTAILQFWDRNTLLLDLTALSGEGEASLHAAHGWPVRLEFKVQPGSMAQLEVRALARTVFEVPSQGKPVVLKLAAGAYVGDTPQITIRWSGAGGLER